jgi:hypothetical protein
VVVVVVRWGLGCGVERQVVPQAVSDREGLHHTGVAAQVRRDAAHVAIEAIMLQKLSGYRSRRAVDKEGSRRDGEDGSDSERERGGGRAT